MLLASPKRPYPGAFMNGSKGSREMPFKFVFARSNNATTNTNVFRGSLNGLESQAGIFQFASCRKLLIGARMKDPRVAVDG